MSRKLGPAALASIAAAGAAEYELTGDPQMAKDAEDEQRRNLMERRRQRRPLDRVTAGASFMLGDAGPMFIVTHSRRGVPMGYFRTAKDPRKWASFTWFERLRYFKVFVNGSGFACAKSLEGLSAACRAAVSLNWPGL